MGHLDMNPLRLISAQSACMIFVVLCCASYTPLSAVSAQSAVDGQQQPEVPLRARGAGYTELVFEDNFDVLSLSPNGAGSYRWYKLRSLGQIVPADHFRHSDGQLTLVTPPGERKGLNASVATFPTDNEPGTTPSLFRYGYFEARIRFDPQVNWDNWAAFWLLDPVHQQQSSKDAKWCEIDVVEAVSPTSYVANAHDWTGGRPPKSVPSTTKVVSVREIDFRNWNVFGLLWEPNTITWYLNNQIVMSAPTPEPCKSGQLSIVLQAAKRGGLADQTLEVDWVKVYR
jgi:hypothetical protein